LVVLIVLGVLHSRYYGASILSAYCDCQLGIQVRHHHYFTNLDKVPNIQPSSTIAQAQLLNIPAAIFACILTIIFGIFANTGRIPQPSIPLGFMIVILACYSVLYTFPNTGGEYAATMIAGGFSTAW
jgi:hypothetical protein